MPETMQAEPYRFEFVGGEPCLDFTNTVGGIRRTAPKEHLHTYADLVSWGRQAGLLGSGEARSLLLRAQREPAAAAAALGSAVQLRAGEALRALGDGGVQLAVRRREPQRPGPLVQHEGLRQPRKGTPPLRTR